MSGDHNSNNSHGITTKLSPGSVDGVVARLLALIGQQGMTVFVVVDHDGEARRAGLQLRETKLVIFGSPLAGTPVMQVAPLAALDLPLKILVWDDNGQTKVSYIDSGALAARYHLAESLAEPLAGIELLTDALVAR